MLHIHLHEEMRESPLLEDTLNPFQTIHISIFGHSSNPQISLLCFTESSIINIWKKKTSVLYCATKVSLMVQLVLVLLSSYVSQFCYSHINNVLTVYIHSRKLSP